MGVCVTLPVREAPRFADRIASLKPAVVATHEFHAAKGFGADTSPEAVRLRDELRWGGDEYRRFVEALGERVTVYEGEVGFFPPGWRRPLDRMCAFGLAPCSEPLATCLRGCPKATIQSV